MSRIAALFTLCAACALAACGSDDKVQILVFQAAPDAIEAGQSTQLVFAVEPADAHVTITGLGDVTGKTAAPVAPAVTTSYELTATRGHATANRTVTVTVGAAAAAAIRVEPQVASPAAGDALAVTLTVLGPDGKPAPGFRGTLHLTSTDPRAVLPGDVAFTAADAGVKQVMVTLETAGASTLVATDATGRAGASGSATLTVRPGAAVAASCVAGQAPATGVAGAPVVVTVTTRDAFGNQATGYAGTIRLTASDARATLPADATFGAGDAGSRAFSVTLITTGSQTVTASDLANPAIQCSAPIAISPAAPTLVLRMPASANAGYPVTVDVAVQDVFDNAIPTFAGTVAFASTDPGAGAATPAPITFTGGEGGVASTLATFITPGPQTLSATGGSAAGSATATVHGLVYTGPGAGRVRLVANPAQSSAQVVQLDLVASERLEVSSFFAGGPGPFGAGMNLPLDTTRVTGDAPVFLPGAALPLGTGTPAALGRIGPDHVLYTVVSTKRIPGPNFFQSTDVPAGKVFYSVRLRLTPTGTPGAVFDGADPSPLYRAAVRDQYGDDVVSQGDIGVGKLEIR
jgi:hypothetical protein